MPCSWDVASGLVAKGLGGAVTSVMAPRATAIAATVAPALRSWAVAATPAAAAAATPGWAASAAAATPGWAVLIRAAAVPRPPFVQGVPKVPALHGERAPRNIGDG